MSSVGNLQLSAGKLQLFAPSLLPRLLFSPTSPLTKLSLRLHIWYTFLILP